MTTGLLVWGMSSMVHLPVRLHRSSSPSQQVQTASRYSKWVSMRDAAFRREPTCLFFAPGFLRRLPRPTVPDGGLFVHRDQARGSGGGNRKGNFGGTLGRQTGISRQQYLTHGIGIELTDLCLSEFATTESLHNGVEFVGRLQVAPFR